MKILSAELTTELNRNVNIALEEDIGTGDLTAQFIDDDIQLSAQVIVREPALLCGIPWFNAVMGRFSKISPVDWLFSEGDQIPKNSVICQLSGNARELLSAERTALNFLQLYSGIATTTRKYVDAVGEAQCLVMDTRKTIPGHRLAQKYAVRVGGGANQRIGLFDGVLIKENHISSIGGITPTLQKLQKFINDAPHIPAQIEVENLGQFEVALDAGIKLILLDNFDSDTIAEALQIIETKQLQHKIKLEVSGGVNLETIAERTQMGVDRISIGKLTKDVQSIDFSMLFQSTNFEQNLSI